MNILREARRFNQKSMTLRIISILLFSVMLIASTFAWFSIQKDIRFGGLTGDVTSWDVEYYIDGETNPIINEIATFTIDQFYPGMQRPDDIVHVYNIGTSSTNITYELISVKLFGEEILGELDLQVDSSTNTTTIFSEDTQYPFRVSYTYDKTYLKGKYVDDTTTPEAHSTFKFSVKWAYEDGGSAEEIEDRDELDTSFGKAAYEYYQREGSDPSKAIEVKVKITSSMIHPSLEAE